jgi:Acetyltransferase (GNAT) family.
MPLPDAPTGLELRRLGSPEHAFPFRSMTFPRFVPVLRQAGANPGVVAIGATIAGGPADGSEVGLALGWLGPTSNGAAELLSLNVRADRRGTGIGRALLAELERVFIALGAASLASVYMTRLPSVSAFEAVLRARGWSDPVRRMLVFRTRRERLREADWFDLFQTLPPGTQIKPWHEITDVERAVLQRNLAENPGRAPDDVNPFRFEGRGIDDSAPEPALSLACLVDGEIVGWNMAHRIGPASVRFSCSYVWPDKQARLPLLALWDWAFHRLEPAGYTHVSWAVSPHHEAMVRFNEQMLLPYVDEFDETRGSIKTFAASL